MLFTNKHTSLYKLLLTVCLFFCFGSCKGPAQPELTKAEVQYFNYLKKNCDCAVKRSISYGLLMGLDDEGGYMLILDSLPCNLLSKDLQPYAYRVSKYLYCYILNRDKKYNKITIEYACQLVGANENSVSFHFAVDSLK